MISTGFTLLTLACVSRTPPGPAPERRSPETPAASLTPAPNVQGDPVNGRHVFMTAGCTGCHTLRGVPGATGLVGPNLTNVALRPTLAAGAVQNSPQAMARWIMDPPAVKPGTAMPKLGLTEQQARDVAALLYSQPADPALQR